VSEAILVGASSVRRLSADQQPESDGSPGGTDRSHSEVRVDPWSSARRLCRVTASVLIAVVAIGLRLWQLRDVPRLTDETDEVMRGLAIARGELLPLTNVDAYIGPLWSYLLALGFLVAGPSSLLPRFATMLAGLLTVAATAWLGRELALRLGLVRYRDLVALGAALLLATSSFHVIVSSRIAWSHALTPLATTVAIALLVRWDRTGDGKSLAAAGLAYGLAVHTHPTAVAFAPGLGLWGILQGRRVLASRATWAALGLFLLANLPMLLFNLMSGLGSAAAAAQVQNAYAGGAPTTFGGYLANLDTLLTSLPLQLGGDVGDRRGSAVVLDDPLTLVYAALALLGLAFATRKRLLLPTCVLASAALVLPLVNGKYEPLFNGRYLAPLLPMGFGLLAVGTVQLATAIPTFRTRVTVVASAVLLMLTVPPIVSLYGYVDASLRDGPNNQELYRAAEIVAAARPSGSVLVDATLSGTRQSTGRDGTGVLDYLLILDQHLAVQRFQPNDFAQAVARHEGDVAVVSPRLLTRLDKDFITEAPPGEDEARQRRRAGFVVVRIVGPA
jgi:4-amino-4-deoxy-L-arabinose transferase-like glycosyltransferase